MIHSVEVSTEPLVPISVKAKVLSRGYAGTGSTQESELIDFLTEYQYINYSQDVDPSLYTVPPVCLEESTSTYSVNQVLEAVEELIQSAGEPLSIWHMPLLMQTIDSLAQ